MAAKLVIACNYSPLETCKGLCDKCRYLPYIVIIDLNAVQETQPQ